MTDLAGHDGHMDRRSFLGLFAVAGASALVGCSTSQPQPAPRASTTPPGTPTPTSSASPTPARRGRPRVESVIATGLNVPWGIAFVSATSAVVTQRDTGTLIRLDDGQDPREVGRVGDSVGFPGGEGGALGIVVDPQNSRTLYAYVTTNTDNRVVRLRMRGRRIADVDDVLTGIPKGGRHHGGRMIFGDDGYLYVATGDAGDASLAQRKDSLAGKILRIDTRGKAARGNPFGSRVWSYGHRNIEGLAFDSRGRLWATEFGDKTADELNVIERGGNYGWPQVEGKPPRSAERSGLVDPQVTWATDECSPAGLAIVNDVAYVAALQGECLYAVDISGDRAATPRSYLAGEYGRLRSVAAAPDGALWVTTSNTDGRGSPREGDDQIVRVVVS